MFYPVKEVVKRYQGNPILTAKDMPFAARGVYNSGITKYNGKYLMLMRVESINKKQCFWVATSNDGYKFDVAKHAIDIVVPDYLKEEYQLSTSGMIYDPRITKIEDTYYIFYACHGSMGSRIGLAKTKDFNKLEFVAFGSTVYNRNAVLFPEKINGLYCRLERPSASEHELGAMWMSYSPDLIYWGKSSPVATGAHTSWEWKKIGAGAPPIKTKEGWLEIYHAVYGIVTIEVYQLGVMLLDLKDPSKVIARGTAPILYPQEIYERVGEAPNVVFTSGAILEDDGEVKIYYGAADTVQCLATARIEDLIDACFNR